MRRGLQHLAGGLVGDSDSKLEMLLEVTLADNFFDVTVSPVIVLSVLVMLLTICL